MGALHNVTFYVDPDGLDAMREFYGSRLGLPVVFEVPEHICCFEVGDNLAICIHEAEPPKHPAGSRELFFWSDDMDEGDETTLVDPLGNQVRLHAHR